MNTHQWESIEYSFNKAVELLSLAGYTAIASRLKKELDSFKSETYKIAVVGEYKTGKSTLINRIFLKDDVLFTDIMEATAVPTQVSYGTQKLLEVVDYETGKDRIVIKDPCAEDIKLHTSAQTPEGRARLSQNTASVKLSWPANNLDGLTLFDTPGINSINSAVIATTYRILPGADLVLFVTGDKQLSNVELEFLSGRIFSQGITRAVAVVTYAEETEEGKEDFKRRESIAQSIKSQLANIGQENIPVELLNIRDASIFTEPGEKGFINRMEDESQLFESGKRKQDAGDVIKDLLGESDNISGNAPDPVFPGSYKPGENQKGSFAALEKILMSFIRDNVRPARLEKAGKVFEIQIQTALVQCETELSVMNKDEIQRKEILSNLKVREAEMRLKYEKLSKEFNSDLYNVEQRFIVSAQTGLEKIAELYIAGFDACNDLGELQNRLEDARFYLKTKVEDMFIACSKQAEEDIEELVKTYGIKSSTILNPWYSEIRKELEIDGGILAKIPPFALLALDIMLFVRFGPFGPLADILIRLLANYIPFLNKALPVSLAAGMLRKKIKSSLETEFETIKNDLPELIKNNFDELISNIMDEWNSYSAMQISSIRKGVENIAKQPPNEKTGEKRETMLKEIKFKLETMIA